MRKWFSLIELLVVITIIAILTSMLMPALAKARDAGRKAACLNQVKQLFYAHTSFAMDNDGYPTAPERTNTSWEDMLSGYDGRVLSESEVNKSGFALDEAGRHQLYSCPDDDPNRLGTRKQLVRSYAMNRGTPKNWNGARGAVQTGWYVQAKGYDPYSLRFEQPSDPTQAIFLFDYGANNRLGAGAGSAVRGYDVGVSLRSVNGIDHGSSGSFNAVFADGHAAFVRLVETMGEKNLWNAADCRGTNWDWKQ